MNKFSSGIGEGQVSDSVLKATELHGKDGRDGVEQCHEHRCLKLLRLDVLNMVCCGMREKNCIDKSAQTNPRSNSVMAA